MGMTAGAAIGGVASLAGGVMGSNAQTDAANSASATQMQMFNTMQQDLQPYMNLGQSGISGLQNNLSSLTSGVNMNQANLEQTPGYQFQLNQGLKATQNGYAAQGLGGSGAAMKGAAQYAQGLASSNYEQQFNNAVTNQTNTYNRLMGLTGIGQASAAGVGAGAMQTGAGIASNTIGAGNAQAGGYMNGANAIGNAANVGGTANYFNNMMSTV